MRKSAIALLIAMLALPLMISTAVANEGIVTSDELVQQLSKDEEEMPLMRGVVIKNKNQPKPSATIYVYFRTDSTEFADTRSRQQLDALGKALTSETLKGARIEIGGHTDNVGSEAYNMGLSQKRAEAVKSYLEQNYGIGSTDTRGYGETSPVASNHTIEGRAKNRRVVITRLD